VSADLSAQFGLARPDRTSRKFRVHMYYVYILRSLRSNSYYVGHSVDVKKRLNEHNSGAVKATKYKRPYIIVYTESYTAAAEARKREYQIKRQKSKKYIGRLIGQKY